MIDQLRDKEKRFEQVSKELSSPEATSDMKRFGELSKEYKDLQKIVVKFKAYQNILDNIQSSKELLQKEKDPEMKEMAREEIESLKEEQETIEEELKTLLIPKDPNDGKNAIVEIRAGAGGDEASIFAGDLHRMYHAFCEKKGWKIDPMDTQEGTVGGFKEVVFSVSGEDVFGLLKFESGVHRVQRVPATESQGRVHTSAASVVVLPEMEEFDIELNMNDIRKDTYCSSGPGGQSVNTTYSAVRLTHEPTGIVVQCQDEKSQMRNYDKALRVLRSRIYEIELQKKNAELDATRRSMVRTGDRSDKIRTYNYPQSRVTDHRIGLTLYNLPQVMNGDLIEIIEKLRLAENATLMESDKA